MEQSGDIINRINQTLEQHLKDGQLEIMPLLTVEELETIPADTVLLYNNFRQLQLQLAETGAFALDISTGKLDGKSPSGNALNSPLKSLHSNLRHLRWQMLQIADGDYNQKTDFLGDFSDSFNRLIQTLRSKEEIQRELSKTGSILKLISDNISDVIWVLDINLKLTYISPSVERLRGYSPEEIMNQTLNEWIMPASMEQITSLINVALKAARLGRKLKNSTLVVELPCKNGSTVWTELVVGPLYNSRDELSGYSGVSRDITARRETELALIESEQKFKILTQTTSSGIYVYRNQTFEMVNPAFEAMLGYTADELKYLGLKDLVHPDFIDVVTQRAAARFDGSATYSRYEIKAITKTGKIKWLDLSAGLINFFGKPAILGSVFDISHQKKIQLELERTLTTKDKFFSIIGHDLKGPLATINQLLEMITDPYYELSQEEQEKTIFMVKSTAANLFSLLDNLLTWARTQSSSFPFKPRLFNLNTLIKLNIDLFKSSAENKNIRIVFDIAKQVDAVFDYEMMNAIIRNLINNAMKYSFFGNSIFIEAAMSGNRFWVSVRDEGVGMQQEVIDHLFALDRDYKSTIGTQGENGTGLGLILCAEFAKQHGGYIKVDSEPLKGSTFIVNMPVA